MDIIAIGVANNSGGGGGGTPTDAYSKTETDALLKNKVGFAEYKDNKISLYDSSSKDNVIGEIDLPVDMVVDQIKTKFSQKFKFDSTTYLDTENPNLDGKPVLVLAIKTSATADTFSFLNMESLVDVYTGGTTKSAIISVDPETGVITNVVRISAETGNKIVQKDDGLFVPNQTAADVSYSNTTSKLKATTTQAAIDETLGVANSKYSKPETGIPSSHMAQAVKDSLGKADTALQAADKTELQENINAKLDKTAVLNVWSEDEKSTEKTLSEKFIYDNLTTKHDFGEEITKVDEKFDTVNDAIAKLDEQINHRHKVYGFHINSANSNPSNAVTYLEDAIGATPAHMDYTNDKFDYGSWKEAFFMPRPCMLKNDGTVAYYLDENDYNKKADGTDSDISNTAFEGNAMMEWGKNGQKIWYKVVSDAEDSTSVSVYISNFKQDNDYHAYSFIDKNGKYIDHFYTPIYNGSLISDKLRSLSGQSLIKDKSASAEINYAKANGDGWFTEVFCDIELINYLLILIGKSLDTQSVFGNGNQNGYDTAKEHNGVIKSGNIVYGDTECQLNKKGLFWGSNNTVSGVKVFGMENWWANQWRRFAGLVNVQGTAKFKLGYVNEDGSVADYNLDGSGYVTAGTLPSNGYVTKMDYSNGAMIQKTTGGSSTIYYCDYYYNNTASTYYAIRGGHCNDGSLCGAFFVHFAAGAGAANWHFGAALSCKPPFSGVN